MTNLEKLRTATPEQIMDIFCDDCEKCPSFIFERCHVGKNGFFVWLNEEAETQKEEAKMQKDIPKGWIKLKSIVNASDNTLYLKASKIVGVGHSADVDNISGKVVTAVYTSYAEDDPWLVYDSADEVMKKIEKASQEK